MYIASGIGKTGTETVIEIGSVVVIGMKAGRRDQKLDQMMLKCHRKITLLSLSKNQVKQTKKITTRQKKVSDTV